MILEHLADFLCYLGDCLSCVSVEEVKIIFICVDNNDPGTAKGVSL